MVLRRVSEPTSTSSSHEHNMSPSAPRETTLMPESSLSQTARQLDSQLNDLSLSRDQTFGTPTNIAPTAEKYEDELSDWHDSDDDGQLDFLDPGAAEEDHSLSKAMQNSPKVETNPFRRKISQDISTPNSSAGDQWWAGEDLDPTKGSPNGDLPNTSTDVVQGSTSPAQLSIKRKPVGVPMSSAHASSNTANLELKNTFATSELIPTSSIDYGTVQPVYDTNAIPEAASHQNPVQNANPQQHSQREEIEALKSSANDSQSANEVASKKAADDEVYQIKHIRWCDHRIKGSLRESSILMQNANGPCPLLALVNAIVLSTPSSLRTGLTDTLQSREQVSLGLLLDAVFEELMSGRCSSAAQVFPDVSELYTFLITLDTGMNVNPRFVPARPHSFERTIGTPNTSKSGRVLRFGDFERTKEITLYGTFSVPLIHGWLPPPDDPVRDSIGRIAPTYEDAQNYLLLDEEFENKLRDGGLSTEDQQAFLDLTLVKEFLNKWPTQLTEHGLHVIQNGMHSGEFAILFRNDHFSTLYKEPKSGKLMALVTDAGYATHDEIVWESLVDIHGRSSEMYSGDFRSVNHAEQENASQSQQSAKSRTQIDANQSTQESQATSSMSWSEQEDHDLALALQLQEEEEERQRAQQANARGRRRGSERQQPLVSSQGRPEIPERQNNRNSNPPAPINQNVTSEEQPGGAPPSYEQAAAAPPYFPPGTPQQQQRQTRAPNELPGYQNSTAMGRRRAGPSIPVGFTGSPSVLATGRRAGRADRTSSDSVEDRHEGCRVM